MIRLSRRAPEPGSVRWEFETRGVLSTTFPLADSTVLPDLLDDASAFATAVANDRDAGRRRVPYAVTPSIERIAADPSIVSIVAELLGPDRRWVMWGSNIQTGTPNDAGTWHVDLESRLWPTITIAVGLLGCSAANATRYLPESHRIAVGPSALLDQADDDEAIAVASAAHPPCADIITPAGFGDSRFFVFDAAGWHSGNTATSAARTMLFLHYHYASDRRIPMMLDYEQKRWSRDAAPFVAGPAGASGDRASTQVNPVVARPPSEWLLRARRIERRIRLASARATSR